MISKFGFSNQFFAPCGIDFRCQTHLNWCNFAFPLIWAYLQAHALFPKKSTFSTLLEKISFSKTFERDFSTTNEPIFILSTVLESGDHALYFETNFGAKFKISKSCNLIGRKILKFFHENYFPKIFKEFWLFWMHCLRDLGNLNHPILYPKWCVQCDSEVRFGLTQQKRKKKFRALPVTASDQNLYRFQPMPSRYVFAFKKSLGEYLVWGGRDGAPRFYDWKKLVFSKSLERVYLEINFTNLI